MFYCPEGAEEFSPGFQTWGQQVRRFALKLKGREIIIGLTCAINAFDPNPPLNMRTDVLRALPSSKNLRVFHNFDFYHILLTN
jgi:hypothetical protein